MRSLENIEEQFNLYMRTALFLVVDEFRMADSGSVGKMADKLKHQLQNQLSPLELCVQTKLSCRVFVTLYS